MRHCAPFQLAQLVTFPPPGVGEKVRYGDLAVPAHCEAWERRAVQAEARDLAPPPLADLEQDDALARRPFAGDDDGSGRRVAHRGILHGALGPRLRPDALPFLSAPPLVHEHARVAEERVGVRKRDHLPPLDLRDRRIGQVARDCGTPEVDPGGAVPLGYHDLRARAQVVAPVGNGRVRAPADRSDRRGDRERVPERGDRVVTVPTVLQLVPDKRSTFELELSRSPATAATQGSSLASITIDCDQRPGPKSPSACQWRAASGGTMSSPPVPDRMFCNGIRWVLNFPVTDSVWLRFYVSGWTSQPNKSTCDVSYYARGPI